MTCKFRIEKTTVMAKFNLEADDMYHCLCGKVLEHQLGAGLHLNSLSLQEKKESHSAKLWKNRYP